MRGPDTALPLLHGAEMPRLGFGTAALDDARAEALVAAAIGTGYRLVDTAENYGNEVGVGKGLRASGVAREELFVTTKFNKAWHGVDLVAEACARSADRLGLDYLDLLLIHWPNPAQDRYVDAWRGLAKLLDAGRVRAIGTSNFTPAHLDRIVGETGVVPDVNQIQLSPAIPRVAEVDHHRRLGIVTESWAPLGGPGAPLLRDPAVIALAARHGRTPAQVVLRWHLQQGFVVIPKASSPERIGENFGAFDFALAPADMDAVAALADPAARPVDPERFGH